MKKSLSGIAALSVAFAGAAFAQNATTPQSDSASGSQRQGHAQFSTVDTNRDGRISQTEARSAGGTLGSSFTMLDTDKDTYLSQTEYGKWNSGSSQGGTSSSDSSRMPAGQSGADGTSGKSPSQSGSSSSQSTGPAQSSGDSTSRPGSDSTDRPTR